MRAWVFGSALVLTACSFDTAVGESAGIGGSESSAATTDTPATTDEPMGTTTSKSTSTSASTTSTPASGTTAATNMSAGDSSDTEESTDAADGTGSGDSSNSDESSGTGGELQGMLDVVRLELPCIGTRNCSSAYCDSPGTSSATQTLMGEAMVTYDVTLRIRGVVEQKSYAGGTTDGFWNEGGAPAADDWNVYLIEISDPAQLYYINAGSSGNAYSDRLDYTRTVPMRSGASLTVTMSDTNACGAYNVDIDGNPIVIEDIPPAPDPFDGQFVQVDATAIVPQ